ncbi:Tim44/TimA family putative adaptor protein [Paraurantiacibacter namhicola]|uniref:Tim44-like domain protein n=1 Tax=Paraurantiacibacter namhicola TaxID=645517 RepID=A0A1C7DBF7_9SPHN|nr:Tim44/TimA family putative adaptor protein [Paraurantiacibacter namhicola]ANU08826.1 Tim44-like domain protein [Paraurantiacibacter namhicola]
MILEIVILAAIAVFLGLRLYSVLGRRAEHEEEAAVQRFEAKREAAEQRERQAAQVRERPDLASTPQAEPAPRALVGFPPAIEKGLQQISGADRGFDLLSFLEGAKAAYGMILEAFWEGDKDTLRELCDDDVYASFAGAIDARDAAGETLANKLIRIEDETVHSASLDGKVARIAVRFVSDIAAVTRDKDGNVIAGSLDDAVESRDIWTFSRDIGSGDPAWLLDETDAG